MAVRRLIGAARLERLTGASLAMALCLAACGGGGAASDHQASSPSSSPTAPSTSPSAAPSTQQLGWVRFLHVAGVVDLSLPRRDGTLVVAAAGRLSLLTRGGRLVPFARGSGGYRTILGPEPYVALSNGRAVPGAGCAFPPDVVYAIQPTISPGVIAIDGKGHAGQFASLPHVRPNGIVFDDVGRFGFRLLVTAGLRGTTMVFAIDCKGNVATIAPNAPSVEGGITVAPRSFGRFGGDLVAPDERSGRLWAIDSTGRARLIARSPLRRGPDIGVESIAFLPPAFDQGWSAYVADRRTPGNPHPGTDSILTLSGAGLVAAGVRVGDLIVAGEGGAQTIAIRCSAKCTVRHIADGPRTSHVEGHIVFVPTLA